MAKPEGPIAEKWYPVTLGETCYDDSTSRYYSLRYEFKPASIDLTRSGSLNTSTDNKATVEFHNNQPGKPKVGFQGNIADYQELDAVLFFDGKSLRLERMHRAVKSLRHIRTPGESSAAATVGSLKESDADSPQDANAHNVERISSLPAVEKMVKQPAVPLARSERIEAEEAQVSTKPDPPAADKATNKKNSAETKMKKGKKNSPVPPLSPVDSKRKRESSPIDIEIDDEGEDITKAAAEEELMEVEEVVEEIEEEVSDYEEVDISEDEEDKTGVDQTAAALRAQVAAGLGEDPKASSSSSSSGSGSSESGSGSSSSESGSDEEDSASSGDDGGDI